MSKNYELMTYFALGPDVTVHLSYASLVIDHSVIIQDPQLLLLHGDQ